MLPVFDLKKATGITETRICTMDCIDNIFCCADDKGVLYVKQIDLSDTVPSLQPDQNKKVDTG